MFLVVLKKIFYLCPFSYVDKHKFLYQYINVKKINSNGKIFGNKIKLLMDNELKFILQMFMFDK